MLALDLIDLKWEGGRSVRRTIVALVSWGFVALVVLGGVPAASGPILSPEVTVGSADAGDLGAQAAGGSTAGDPHLPDSILRLLWRVYDFLA